MGTRAAKAKLTEEAMAKLRRGETVTINVPPGVSQLQLSTELGDIFSSFDGILDGLFDKAFGRKDKSNSRSHK